MKTGLKSQKCDPPKGYIGTSLYEPSAPASYIALGGSFKQLTAADWAELLKTQIRATNICESKAHYVARARAILLRPNTIAQCVSVRR